MITPKEKAIELVDKFENYSFMDIDARISSFTSAKQCALIAVNEIIESRKADPDFDDTKLGIVTHYIAPHPLRLSYWTKVKEELEKL